MKRLLTAIVTAIMLLNGTFALSEATIGEANALRAAESYLESIPFSYDGLISQLEYEGYSNSEATYAADNCGADWYEQALKSAKNYLLSIPFSYSGLIDQLEYDGYSNDEATYSANNCGADWNQQAVLSAKNYLGIMAFSRSGLIEQLEYDGFTHDQAVYGVEHTQLGSADSESTHAPKLTDDQVETMADNYTTNSNDASSWTYYAENPRIPIPNSCILGLKEGILVDSIYIYPIQSSKESIQELCQVYLIILMKDCGLQVEQVDGPMYSISSDSTLLGYFGYGSDTSVGGDFLIVAPLFSEETTTNNVTHTDVIDNAEDNNEQNGVGSYTHLDAESIQINLSTATDAELKEAILMIQVEQVERYKDNLANQEISTDTDGISFRNIPWFSTLECIENELGQVSKHRSADDLRRLSYIDYSSVSDANDRVDGDLGCNICYSGLSVAGYTPSMTRICYIFPIVEGQIVREFELAQMYMGYYEFEDEDYGNLISIYDDLGNKLEKLYGKGKSSSNEYFTNIVWQDADGNIIRLQVNEMATYLTLAYVASTADSRLDEMDEAYAVEKKQAEDAIRYENINNTDGL